MTETETCPKIVSDSIGWHSHRCDKPAKRDGLCGIHAAAKERVAANDRAREDKKAKAQIVVDRLNAHQVRAYVSWDGEPNIGIDAYALADLLDAAPTTRRETEPETDQPKEGEHA